MRDCVPVRRVSQERNLRAWCGAGQVPWIGEAHREKTVSEIFSSDGVNSAA
jgi:hypothetical protein